MRRRPIVPRRLGNELVWVVLLAGGPWKTLDHQPRDPRKYQRMLDLGAASGIYRGKYYGTVERIKSLESEDEGFKSQVSY